MFSGSENWARTPPAALDVDPPASWPRSTSRTSTPASARWKAALVPMTPPPTTTTSARAGRRRAGGPPGMRRLCTLGRSAGPDLPPGVVLQVGSGGRAHQRHAAVREPRGARHVSRARATQEGDDLGHLPGVPGPAQGYAGATGLAGILVLLTGH